MSIFDKVFTDSVKDVIGNDLVLDQFDISYNASFYGTMQDDYITGSLLSIGKNESGGIALTKGERGRAFSKCLTDNQPALSSVYSSSDVALIPQLSYRQVPWHDRVSRIFNRNMQCFDSSERYYDSCLPDLSRCFQVNKSIPWKLVSRRKDLGSAAVSFTSQTSLSPYGNVNINENAFMIFNSIPLFQVGADNAMLGGIKDPTVNNEWTWSFPYEVKYNPRIRTIKTTDTLGINSTDLMVNWDTELSGATFPNLKIKFRDRESTGRSTVNGFVPILPGNLEGSSINAIGGRNSLRVLLSGSTANYSGFPSYGVQAPYRIDVTDDDKLGVSFLIPSDVNLGQYSDHSFLSNHNPPVFDPGNELLTGSMTTDDTIKFLFGFGDLNNMTYSKYNYTSMEDPYEEDFELNEQGLVTYYFSGSVGSAEIIKRQFADMTLIRSLPDTANEFRQESSEVPLGWVSLAGFDISWTTNNNDPNSTTIPSGAWSFYLNCQGNASKIRVQIYKWDGSTRTLLGSTEEKSLSTSMTLLGLVWTISSQINLLVSDRILVDVQGELNLPTAGCYATFKNRHDYLPLGMLRRYSRIDTNLPAITYNPGIKYTASYELNSYDQGGLIVNWSNSPTTKPWNTVYRSGSTTIESKDYNFWGPGPLSGTITPKKRGLFGLADITNNNYFILYSSGSYDPAQQAYSICCMDITSSKPWTISYDRAVAGKGDSFLTSYISGHPGKPSHQLLGSPFEEIEILEVVTGSNNDSNTVFPTKKYYHDYFLTFNSGLQHGGTATTPSTFPPGEWRVNFKLDWQSITGPLDDEFVMTGLDKVTLTTYSVEGDRNSQKIGGNNYPQFRTYRVDPRVNETLGFSDNSIILTTKSLHEANIFAISPVIRGWKYGLYSGLPMNSKAIFRRNRYGQFRDMLEQRQYTKFINVNDSPNDDDAVVKNNFSKFTSSRLSRTKTINPVGPSVVEVNFLKQRYKKNDRGIGFVYNESVSPEMTFSQNLSTEVTSSLPYFDGESKTRQESDMTLINDTAFTTLQIDASGLTVI